VPYPALASVLRSLRGVAAASAAVPDAELVQRFAAVGDASAFELLVWRHGPMVLGVCRRVLRQEQDAEDAFQAAFLALARKAGSVGRRGSVGGWLYRVAHRIALDARERAARRRHRERAAGRRAEAAGVPDPAAEAGGRELWRVLDDELGRLPERCREAFVLCCLEGRSGPEAARELGCAAKAVESRLARARARLRAGLARRGLLPPAVLTAAALCPATAKAGLPPPLVAAALRTVALAGGRAATGAAVSAHVLSLTEGVLRTMLVSKLKAVGAVVLAAGVIGAGAGGLGYRTWAAEGPGDGAAAQARPQQGTTPARGERVARTLDGAELLLTPADPTAGEGDELRQLKALMEQQKALADRLEALARQLQTKGAAGRQPLAAPGARSLPALPGSAAGTPSNPVERDAEQQRLRGLLDIMAKALTELKAAIPEADAAWKARMVQKGYLAPSQAAGPQAGAARRTLQGLEDSLNRLRAELQEAGLLDAAAGRPASAPPEVGRGTVRDVTPGGLAVLEVVGEVLPGQALDAWRQQGGRWERVGEVHVVLANGKEAVARVVNGRAQRGDSVRDGGGARPFLNDVGRSR
jgi:RNA polymerase sigma factor (sigma-70 family)